MRITQTQLRRLIKEELENLRQVVFDDGQMEGSGGGPLRIGGRDIDYSDPLYDMYYSAWDDGEYYENSEFMRALHGRGVTHANVRGYEDPQVQRFAQGGVIPLDVLCDIYLPGTADELWPEDY